MRCRIFLPPICAIAIVVASVVQGQQSDEVRQKPLEVRSAEAAETATPSETPKAKPKKKHKSASPSPTAKPKPHPKPSETPEPTPKASSSPHHKKKSASARKKASESDESESASPKPEKSPAKAKSTAAKKKTGAKGEETPAAKGKGKAKKKPSPTESEAAESKPVHTAKPSETPATRTPSSTGRGAALPTPSSPPVPGSAALSAAAPDETEQLTIEKYGYEKPKSFWQRLFGGGTRTSSSGGAGYRYLTRSIRAEIDRVGADRRNPRWQLIVVHNSGTRQGNARAFDYYHKHVRHMQNGLAYHFVIGNGTSTGNGEIEVGNRWRRQLNGGHVHSDYLNSIAIGICLVGDFNRDQPSRAQLDCCEELIRYLRQRCGKFDNSHFPVVKPHREVNPPRWATDCPGDVFPYSWFRRFRE